MKRARRAMPPKRKGPGVPWLLCMFVLGFLTLSSSAWVPTTTTTIQRPAADGMRIDSSVRHYMTATDAATVAADTTSNITDTQRRPCYYRSPAHKNQWRPRIELSELEIGQELQATVVQELLQAKTGPKVFCEVGVGRYRPQYAHTFRVSENNKTQWKDWQIVTAMLRLGPPGKKESVARKRAARLRKKAYFPVYVSRIRPASVGLEVCLTREEALQQAERSARKIPTRNLRPGQVVTGRVVRVLDYGVLVDIGATRKHGLLHIQTVAYLLGRYIDKAPGLVNTAGLERGTRVELQIARIRDNGDIALDFTPQAQQAAEQERQDKEKDNRMQQHAMTAPTESSKALSKEEEEAWAAFAANPTSSTSQEDEQDEEYDDEDEFDEDREIEDALGLGYY